MDAIPTRCRSSVRGCALLCLICGIVSGALAEGQHKAPWFPDPPNITRYSWTGESCEGCDALTPRPDWEAMAALAGLGDISFLLASDESRGQAWSYAPNVVVLAPSALKLPHCQLAFLVGHELVHIAQRHFDEDAHNLLVLSAKPANWTLTGETAMGLLDGNFSLALQMSPIWQQQERQADWVGSLLAAQACRCSLKNGALSYFSEDDPSGGGLAASHDIDSERVNFLKPFADSARKLSSRTP
jgi:Zn-dependent protease with chaperone function